MLNQKLDCIVQDSGSDSDNLLGLESCGGVQFDLFVL